MAGSSKAKARFILRRTGGGAASSSGSNLPEHLNSVVGVTVLDASPLMVLVDAPRETLARAMKQYQGWEIIPETLTPLPDTRVKLGRR
ncbi:MAG: hypothetical protein H0X13_12530 [Ramlibacter sp.]|nr:hypothetical protein [Ramlibacter sp.]